MRDLEEAAAIGMTLAVWASEAPDRPAVVTPSGSRTFGELNARANMLARALRAAGLGAGDGIALLASNRCEYADVLYAAQRSGMRLTPINWHLTADEVAYIARDCEAKAFVTDVRFAGTAHGVVAPDAKVRLSIGGAVDGFDDLDAFVAGHEASDLGDPALGIAMLYTSGTTGRPKGVYRETISANATMLMTQQTSGYRPGEDLHLCTGPLYHAAPNLFSLRYPLSMGVGTVLMDGWDPEGFLEHVQRYRITHTHVVPVMFHRLLRLPDDVWARYDTSSLRWIVHGAAPCPVEVKHAMFARFGAVIHEYYAATEGGGTWITPEEWLDRPGSVGRPAPGQTIEVRGEDGTVLPPGEVGTVWIKGPDVGRFSYFKDPEKTASTYDPDGFFTLRDMGYFDTDGYLFLTDRTADLIISGGVNIYPAEVDAVLATHPAVADVATIGVPNEEWGEEVKSVVERAGGRTVDAAELIAFCRERLAGFKCPRTVDFVDRLPRDDNGKIYKRKLRERYRTGRDRRI